MYRVMRGEQALIGYYGTREAAESTARSEALRTGSRYRVDHRPIGGKWDTICFAQPTREKWGLALPDGTMA